MADWFQENKRTVYIIGAIILILFTVLLMLKFWMYTVVAIASFVGGYFFAKRGERDKYDRDFPR